MTQTLIKEQQQLVLSKRSIALFAIVHGRDGF